MNSPLPLPLDVERDSRVNKSRWSVHWQPAVTGSHPGRHTEVRMAAYPLESLRSPWGASRGLSCVSARPCYFLPAIGCSPFRWCNWTLGGPCPLADHPRDGRPPGRGAFFVRAPCPPMAPQSVLHRCPMRDESPPLEIRVRVKGKHRRHADRFTTYGAIADAIAARTAAKARKVAARVERRAESSARYRALKMAVSDQTGRRVILAILERPTPAGVNRLAGFLLDPRQPTEVRWRAARAMLFLAYGPPLPPEEEEKP